MSHYNIHASAVSEGLKPEVGLPILLCVDGSALRKATIIRLTWLNARIDSHGQARVACITRSRGTAMHSPTVESMVLCWLGVAGGNLSSEHREQEGEAGYPLAGGALPQEGATRAPVIEINERRRQL